MTNERAVPTREWGSPEEFETPAELYEEPSIERPQKKRARQVIIPEESRIVALGRTEVVFKESPKVPWWAEDMAWVTSFMGTIVVIVLVLILGYCTVFPVGFSFDVFGHFKTTIGCPRLVV